jgi:hypothetical protein
MARKVGLPPEHFIGGRPVRPFTHVRNVMDPGPSEARASHADAITHGAAAAQHQIEQARARIDDDRSRRLFAVVADFLAHEATIEDDATVPRFNHAGADVAVIAGMAVSFPRSRRTQQQELNPPP